MISASKLKIFIAVPDDRLRRRWIQTLSENGNLVVMPWTVQQMKHEKSLDAVMLMMNQVVERFDLERGDSAILVRSEGADNLPPWIVTTTPLRIPVQDVSKSTHRYQMYTSFLNAFRRIKDHNSLSDSKISNLTIFPHLISASEIVEEESKAIQEAYHRVFG